MCLRVNPCAGQGMKNPLDNVSQLTPRAASKPEDKAKKAATGMYQYFLKVCVGGVSCLGAGGSPTHSPAGWGCEARSLPVTLHAPLHTSDGFFVL